MSVHALMKQVREVGGDLTLNGDKIHISAPSPLPADVLNDIRQHKAGIIAALTPAVIIIPASIRRRFEERTALAMSESGLSRIDAEVVAWDEVRTCVICQQETIGEGDGVRVSGGGWLHLDKCYDRYFGFRRE